MERVVGVPIGTVLIGSRFGAQTAFWLDNIGQWYDEQGLATSQFNSKTAYRALEDVEEVDVVDEQDLDSEEIHLNNQDTSIKSIRRVRREK
ncbi:hypothetical protein BGZ80_010111 [Entomortierella chlamydospora]|uniref:Uncharacterized protein n=1 Tax=Entomortierella chlamydospora TaxID=101097 RepID=A0A9P6N372_9FUNG|nr:hypothetical protein BGZ80_010111 [Entomortierella chlamydospora]